MNRDPKQFALEQVAPYYLDPSTCGYDPETKKCEYLTKDGRMCVAGKNMLHPEKYGTEAGVSIFPSISGILGKYSNQADVFKPEVVGILSDDEWLWLQRVHDTIASRAQLQPKSGMWLLAEALFTYDELVQYCATLKPAANA